MAQLTRPTRDQLRQFLPNMELVKRFEKLFMTSNLKAGTFTAANAAETTVNDADVTASSIIFVFPTNASGATLTGSAASLYISARVAGVSFTVATADASSAAGTETFNYLIVG